MFMHQTVLVVGLLAAWAVFVWGLTRAPLPPESPVFATGRYAATAPQPVQAERPAQAGRSFARWPSGALVGCWFCGSEELREVAGLLVCDSCSGGSHGN